MESAGLQPGDLIEGTYRIVRRIGEGGMGEVYEATHARLAGRYAIKLLLREIATDTNLLARFQREAQITSSLRHPNIIQVLDFRQTPDGIPFLVMEFLEGVDLAHEIRRAGPLPIDRVRGFVDQIASGLSAAHEQGIVHRDLKPANLFLVVLPGSHRELVKIVDFGISKVKASDAQLTRTAAVMGTPQYMAPEQARGEIDRIDARSDQFSFACVVYEMIAGRAPFSGETVPALMYQLVHVDPKPLTENGRGVATAIDAVVKRGLSKRFEDRYPGVIEFAQAFEAAARDAGQSEESSARAGVAAAAGRTLVQRPDRSGGTRVSVDRPQRDRSGVGGTTFGSTASEVVAPSSLSRSGGRLARRVQIGIAVGVLAVLGLVLSRLGSRSPTSVARVVDSPAANPPVPAPVRLTPEPSPPLPTEAVKVDVRDPPPGLVAGIDGGEARPLPARLSKGSGIHVIQFSAPGYLPQSVKVDASEDVALVLSLRKVADLGGAHRREPASQPAVRSPGPTAPQRRRSRAIIDL